MASSRVPHFQSQPPPPSQSPEWHQQELTIAELESRLRLAVNHSHKQELATAELSSEKSALLSQLRDNSSRIAELESAHDEIKDVRQDRNRLETELKTLSQEYQQVMQADDSAEQAEHQTLKLALEARDRAHAKEIDALHKDLATVKNNLEISLHDLEKQQIKV
jgi:Ran GTPase-activating protein (RanGAP) involved in mRNA processing and transport